MSRTNNPWVLMPRSKWRLSPLGPVHIAATSAGSLDGICWWYWPFGGLGLFDGCAGALVPGLTGKTRNPNFASATALSRIVIGSVSTAIGGRLRSCAFFMCLSPIHCIFRAGEVDQVAEPAVRQP